MKIVSVENVGDGYIVEFQYRSWWHGNVTTKLYTEEGVKWFDADGNEAGGLTRWLDMYHAFNKFYDTRNNRPWHPTQHPSKEHKAAQKLRKQSNNARKFLK